MAKEKNLDNKVLNYLDEIEAWAIKYWAGAKYTKKGIPDILACINGYFFGIEDKAKTGKPSLLQLKNLEWIRKAGGYGILLYPDDFEILKKFILHKTDRRYPSFDAEMWYQENIELQKQWKEKLENF